MQVFHAINLLFVSGAQSDSELIAGSSNETGDRGYNSDGELYAHDPAAIAGKHMTEAKGQVVEAKPLPASHGSWMLVRQSSISLVFIHPLSLVHSLIPVCYFMGFNLNLLQFQHLCQQISLCMGRGNCAVILPSIV